MKLIVGIGNYPKEYYRTRHNIGFELIDYIRDKFYSANSFQSGNLSEFFKVNISGENVFFVKPHTYMNLSGECVLKFAKYYKIPAEDILIIHDEVDLDFGLMKLANGKGTGGHNGIASLIGVLGKDFYRLRLGVKNPDLKIYGKKNFVLGKFREDEVDDIYGKLYPESVEVINSFIKGDIGKIMTKVNRRKNSD